MCKSCRPMFNLAVYMYTSEITTASMLLLYTQLRNVAFNTITAVDGKILAYLTRNILLRTFFR